MTGIPKVPSIDWQPPSWWPRTTTCVVHEYREFTDAERQRFDEAMNRADEAFARMDEAFKALRRG